MSKQALVDLVADEAGLTKKDAAAAINAIGNGIQTITNGGGRIVLPGFGTFKVKHRAARTAKNPRTGEPISIAARDELAFKASRA